MKRMLLLLAIPLLMVSCNAQTTKRNNETEKQMTKKGLNTNQPKVDVKVNKQYDENGNLIGYDSTYVWTYSNENGDSVNVNIDSVLSHFKPVIGSNFPGFLNNYNNDFFGDSLFYHDFLTPAYFMGRWEKEMGQMNRMMQEMDSLKEAFFREHYPELKKRTSPKKTHNEF